MDAGRTVRRTFSNARSYVFSFGIESRFKYADCIVFAMFRKLYNRFDLVEMVYKEGNALLFQSVKTIFDDHIKQIYSDQFNFGFFAVKQDIGLTYVPAKNVVVSDSGCAERGTNTPVDVFYSTTFQLLNRTDSDVIKDIVCSLDKALNANDTIISRLGVVITAMPDMGKSDAAGILTIEEADKKEIEKDARENYGVLKEQSQFMVFRRALKIQRIALGGSDLNIMPSIELYVKLLCDYTDIPYNRMAISGQSTFNNQKEAEVLLQELAESYTNYFLGLMEKKYKVNLRYRIIGNKRKQDVLLEQQ